MNEAFDPLNTQNLLTLPTSSNVVDLVKVIQQLSEAIRFRLLPGGTATNGHNMAMQSAAHYPPQNTLTPAEAHAQHVSGSFSVLFFFFLLLAFLLLSYISLFGTNFYCIIILKKFWFKITLFL